MLFRWTRPIALRDAAAAVGNALEADFHLHDSLYYGGDYFRAEKAGCTLRVLHNFMEDDGQPFQPELPAGVILLQLDAPQQDDEQRLADRLLDITDLSRVI